jgi:hypothetical protein
MNLSTLSIRTVTVVAAGALGRIGSMRMAGIRAPHLKL